MSFSKVQITAEKAFARYMDFNNGNPGREAVLSQIVDTAYATGHWEIWFDVFSDRQTPYALRRLQERCKQAYIENSK